MSLMWMPAQTTTPAGATARSAAGTSGPVGAEFERKALGIGVAGPGEGKNPLPAVAGCLSDDVRRRAEAVEAEPLRISCHDQGSVSDQTGAQQWCSLQIRILLGQRKAEALIGRRVLGVAAVHLIAREA